MIKMQTEPTINCYRLDNDPTISSNHMKQWATKQGIHFEFITFYLLNEDSFVERHMKTKIEKIRSLMLNCDLPQKLWSLGLSTSVCFKNQSLTKVIREGIIPIQKLTNTVPDLSHLPVWRYTAYLRLSEETLVKSEKFHFIRKKHSFVSYEGHLWLPLNGYKVIWSKNNIFDETCYFAFDLPNKLPASGLKNHQSSADVLKIEDSLAESLNVSENEKMNDVIDIPHLEDLPILSD